MIPLDTKIKAFQKEIRSYHSKNRRDLPWRNTADPYKILVSEVMLQQTQVLRVLEKYKSFLKKFPNVEALAKASITEVLKEWQGLGYNRRGLYLKKTAEIVIKEYNGKFPKDRESLIKLPDIGQSTAGALLAFSYGVPAIFIETNIRSVFLHFFFRENSFVTDTMILELVEKTIDRQAPREWYYALYDYGTHLKASKDKTTRSIHQKSAHYKKQSAFRGSNREIRSLILSYLLKSSTTQTLDAIKKNISPELCKRSALPDDLGGVISKNLKRMEQEGLIISQPKRSIQGWLVS